MLPQPYHSPRVFRLSGSVGPLATNDPEEIKAIQRIIKNAGYRLATGRNMIITGEYDYETREAIIWYQRLLNMSPSGLIHPVDSGFLEALNRAQSPHWQPQHTSGPLYVREGQLTFDAEGRDYITAVVPFRQPQNTPHFSRILHWPKGTSGVTLGRGYDMKERSAGEIFSTLRRADIEEYKAVICSKAAGLSGNPAGEFVAVYGPLVGEITHLQQIRLFEISYREKVLYAGRFYRRISKRIPNAPLWEKLDKKIKEVYVDIFFQGGRDITRLTHAAAKGKIDLIKFLTLHPHYMAYESNRKRVRHLQ